MFLMGKIKLDYGFRTSARAAARTRVCSKDAALFDRKITERVDLISLYILKHHLY
jgi:hypothetical protein